MSKLTRYKIEDCFHLRARIGWQGLRFDEFTDEGPYLVTGTDFINGKVDWDTCYHVSEYRYRQDTGIQLHEQDLLITKDGTIGKTAIVQDCPDKVTLNSGVFVVRAINGSVVPQFLFYILNSYQFKLFMRNILTGSTIKHLNQEHFYKFAFYAPDTDVQHKVVEVLTTVDNVLDKTRAMVTRCLELKQGLMHDLLRKGKRVKLSSVCTIVGGSTPNTNDTKYWNGKHVWITPSDLSLLESATISNSQRKLSDEGLCKATGRLLPENSVIISCRAPVGYCAVVTVPFSFNQGCKALICHSIKPMFLYYQLSGAKTKLENFSSGTTFLELPKRELERFEVFCPDTEEQERIVKVLIAADERLNAELEHLRKLEDIKCGLMDDLLTSAGIEKLEGGKGYA